MNSHPLACRVWIATGRVIASGREFTPRCFGEEEEAEKA